MLLFFLRLFLFSRALAFSSLTLGPALSKTTDSSVPSGRMWVVLTLSLPTVGVLLPRLVWMTFMMS